MAFTSSIEQKTTYTVATARHILNTYTFPGDRIKEELYALADKKVNLTYLTHEQLDKRTGKRAKKIHCALYSDPEWQAPWLTMCEADATPPKEPGKIQEGEAEVSETVEITSTGWQSPTVLVLDRSCIESPRSFKPPRAITHTDIGNEGTPECILRDDTHVHDGALIEGGVFTSGKVEIGYATVSDTTLRGGNIYVGDDSYLAGCHLAGNISVRFAMLRNVTLEGDIFMSGNFSPLHEVASSDETKVCIDDAYYVSDFINHPNSETLLQPSSIQHLLEISREALGWSSGDWEFCLDSIRHRRPCRCALYFPLYIMGTPAAVQYMALSGSRVPRLPAGHPYNFLTIPQLEVALKAELRKTWEEHSSIHDIPTSKEEWVNKILRLTNIKPDHA